MSDPHAKLRSQIVAARGLLGLNQTQLAEYLGVSLLKITRAESGVTKSGDILLEIKSGLEQMGIRFTRNGVELVTSYLEIIEGEDCYLKLLDNVSLALQRSENKEFMIMFASDKVSPSEVNARYRAMRKNGVTMRQLIQEGDTYIMGKLDEYKTIPEKYFINIVTVIYADCVAQVSGDGTQVIVHHDANLAKREREIFQYFWDTGKKPKKSTAKEKF